MELDFDVDLSTSSTSIMSSQHQVWCVVNLSFFCNEKYSLRLYTHTSVFACVQNVCIFMLLLKTISIRISSIDVSRKIQSTRFYLIILSINIFVLPKTYSAYNVYFHFYSPNQRKASNREQHQADRRSMLIARFLQKTFSPIIFYQTYPHCFLFRSFSQNFHGIQNFSKSKNFEREF